MAMLSMAGYKPATSIRQKKINATIVKVAKYID
jgi:hypothetical protein